MSNKIFQKDREFTSFIDGVAKKFKIVKPNFHQGNKADLVFKKGFTEAIRAGLATSAQLKEEITSPFFEKVNSKIKEIDVEIIKDTIELDSCEDKKLGLELVYKLKANRAARLVEAMKMNAVFENTAEQYRRKFEDTILC